MTFVVIRTYVHASLAHIDKGILDHHGIQSLIENENTIATDGLLQITVGNIQLAVRSEDADEARGLLSSANDVPLEDGDAGYVCPKCGSADISDYAPFAWTILVPVLFPLLFIRRTACHACGHRWKRGGGAEVQPRAGR